ncbi:DEKNAAC103358 [Brettanomyces naardenensis]|uniref:Copper transport protein n=1 Tax=Brettanomyces naardenensis TaxID=13370 RepID=A0A448YP16_BRENA|nr:DEKNAAC103358 [Brettanomyces naardenensis]
MSHNMAHNLMDHSMPDMKHGEEMCEMSMTLNAGYKNLCILTSHWRIASKYQMVLSMVAIALISMGYELFKRWGSTFEKRYNTMASSGNCTARELRSFKLRNSVVYGVTVFYSFTIMLLFMTFNIWVMLAVTLGAGLGHFFFATQSTWSNSLACH